MAAGASDDWIRGCCVSKQGACDDWFRGCCVSKQNPLGRPSTSTNPPEAATGGAERAGGRLSTPAHERLAHHDDLDALADVALPGVLGRLDGLVRQHAGQRATQQAAQLQA